MYVGKSGGTAELFRPFLCEGTFFLWDCGSAKHGTIRVINISQNDKTEQSDTFMNK